jgi:hypothetical protein
VEAVRTLRPILVILTPRVLPVVLRLASLAKYSSAVTIGRMLANPGPGLWANP